MHFILVSRNTITTTVVWLLLLSTISVLCVEQAVRVLYYVSEWNLFSILAVINFDAVVATETVSATRSDTAAFAGEVLRAPEDSTNR